MLFFAVPMYMLISSAPTGPAASPDFTTLPFSVNMLFVKAASLIVSV